MTPTDRHRWHDDVILALVRSYPEPPVYIEIGVASCVCFDKIAPHCSAAHAVDPSHGSHLASRATGSHVHQWEMTSNQFFKKYNGTPSVVFIDGDHRYSQAEHDFNNAAEILAPDGTIILHDVWPQNRRNTGVAACGDVYRIVDDLRDVESGWETYLYPTFPGLLVCQRSEPLPVERWT